MVLPPAHTIYHAHDAVSDVETNAAVKVGAGFAAICCVVLLCKYLPDLLCGSVLRGRLLPLSVRAACSGLLQHSLLMLMRSWVVCLQFYFQLGADALALRARALIFGHIGEASRPNPASRTPACTALRVVRYFPPALVSQ